MQGKKKKKEAEEEERVGGRVGGGRDGSFLEGKHGKGITFEM